MKFYSVIVLSGIFMLAGCNSILPKADDAKSPTSLLQDIKTKYPEGLVMLSADDLKESKRLSATIYANGLGKVGLGELESEINRIYLDYFKQSEVNLPVQPKVIVRASPTKDYKLVPNGDLILDVGLIRNTSYDDMNYILANSAALMLAGYGSSDQTKMLLETKQTALDVSGTLKNADTAESLKSKAMSFGVGFLADHLQTALLQDSDRLTIELLAVKGIHPSSVLERLPGSQANPITQQSLTNKDSSAPLSGNLGDLFKGLGTSLKETALGPTPSRFEIAKLALDTKPVSVSAPSLTDAQRYVQLMQSQDTKMRFATLDKAYQLADKPELVDAKPMPAAKVTKTKKPSTVSVAPVANLDAAPADMQCAVTVAKVKALNKLSKSKQASMLIEQQSHCTSESQAFTALSILDAESKGNQLKAYQLAVNADEQFDSPVFLLERLRLGKLSGNELAETATGLRCNTSSLLSVLTSSGKQNNCSLAQQGQSMNWLSRLVE